MFDATASTDRVVATKADSTYFGQRLSKEQITEVPKQPLKDEYRAGFVVPEANKV